jgi:hypothetical protein
LEQSHFCVMNPVSVRNIVCKNYRPPLIV